MKVSRHRVIERYQKAAAPEWAWIDLPFDDAIRFLQLKGALTPEAYHGLEIWAHLFAFTVSGVTKLDVIQGLLDYLVESVAEGTTQIDFANSADLLFEAMGVDPLHPFRLENIFRTNVMAAYGRGRWDKLTSAEGREVIWGWKFKAIGDDRTDAECLRLDGTRFKDDQGAEYFPPIHFQCRCQGIFILRDEADEEGLTDSDEVDPIARDFVFNNDFASPALAMPFTPDILEYAPQPLADFLKERFSVK